MPCNIILLACFSTFGVASFSPRQEPKDKALSADQKLIADVIFAHALASIFRIPRFPRRAEFVPNILTESLDAAFNLVHILREDATCLPFARRVVEEGLQELAHFPKNSLVSKDDVLGADRADLAREIESSCFDEVHPRI